MRDKRQAFKTRGRFITINSDHKIVEIFEVSRIKVVRVSVRIGSLLNESFKKRHFSKIVSYRSQNSDAVVPILELLLPVQSN